MNDKPAMPDVRVLVTVTDDGDRWGGAPTLRTVASVVYFGDDGSVRSPQFSSWDSGRPEDRVGVYEGLCVTAQLSAWKGVVDSADFYGRTLGWRDLYSVDFDQAESMVKVGRRIRRHLDRLDERFGRATEFAALLGRFADAVGASPEGPLGIYRREEIFPNGTNYRWMDVDSMRMHLGRRIADWMSTHSLSRKEDTA